MHAVQTFPGQKIDALAAAAGIHINTARDHLNVLEKEGLIVSRPIATGIRGRPPVVFDPVQTSGTNEHADQRAEEAQAKGDLLRRLYPADNHGADLGEDAQHQMDTLYGHLDDVGLDPIPDEDYLGITVAPCSYHGLLNEVDAKLVCTVHARMIEDQLSQVEGPLTLKELRPFVTPHKCHMALSVREKTSRSPEGTPED